MSSGATQVASFFQYRSRTEVVSGGASSASVLRAPASDGGAGEARCRQGKAGLEEMSSVLHVRVPFCLQKTACTR